MKTSSLRLVIASALSSFIMPSLVHADVVVMKDGKKYESATVLSETADSVTFKYMLTPRIPDTRTEQKANIAQIIKQRPEELAIVPLRKLLPSEDLLTADKYEGIIQDQLRPFISQYPGTKEAKEIEAMIATLTEEKQKVVSGMIKMDGQWISADVAKRDARNIDAYRVRKAIAAAAAKSDWTEALAQWDKMHDRDDGFTDTEQYVNTVPEVSKVLESYKSVLDRMLLEQPQLQKHREESTKGLVEPDLSRTKKAIEAEIAKFKSQNDIEKKTHAHWLTVYKYDAKAIQAAAKAVVEEQAKIASLDLPKIKATNEALTAARRYIADQNIELAEAAINKALEAAGRTSSSAIAKMKAEVTRLKSELGKKRATQRIYGSPSALTGSTSSETDDRVAKAMQETAKEKADKKEAKEEDKPKSSGGGITAGSKSGTAHTSKEDKPVRKPSRSSSSDEETAKPEESGIQKYLIIGGGAVLAVLLAAMFMQKKK